MSEHDHMPLAMGRDYEIWPGGDLDEWNRGMVRLQVGAVSVPITSEVAADPVLLRGIVERVRAWRIGTVGESN
jgi:hypothetical protein